MADGLTNSQNYEKHVLDIQRAHNKCIWRILAKEFSNSIKIMKTKYQ